MTTTILKLEGETMRGLAAALGRVLADSVASGAAVGFMQPLSTEEAASWFSTAVFPEVAQGGRVLFAAFLDGDLVGTVQLIVALPPNQPHRAEIAKMIVHPAARRRGIGRDMMLAALKEARTRGKTLVTLDTRTGDVAEPLYASVGFEPAGAIPDFAWDPDRAALHATTYMYKRL